MNQSTLIYLKIFSLFALNSKETKHINKPYSASKQPPFHLLINRCKRENTRGGSPLIYTVFLQFSSVAQSCLTLCDPMGCSMPGLPVHHQILEFTQTHVHWVSDAIQPSHPLSSPFPPAFNLSQHQSLFKWVSSLHQVAKVLESSLPYQLTHMGWRNSPWMPHFYLLEIKNTQLQWVFLSRLEEKVTHITEEETVLEIQSLRHSLARFTDKSSWYCIKTSLQLRPRQTPYCHPTGYFAVPPLGLVLVQRLWVKREELLPEDRTHTSQHINPISRWGSHRSVNKLLANKEIRAEFIVSSE